MLLLVLLFKTSNFILYAQGAQPAPIEFTNATAAAGIKFVHFKGNKGISINREEFGPGVCVADFDQDGWQDIYFVNGRDLYSRGISVSNELYHNNGDGTFTDVTEKAGVPGTGYGLGCVWGDFNNDGFPDLFVTQYGRNVLYRNNGNGTFTDVTDNAGVAGAESGTFHSGATFFDYDRDGWLDLYVGSYVALGEKRYCQLGEVLSSCAPSEYRGSPDALYHNNRDGTFTNVTAAAKIYQPEGKNLSVAAADYDDDGWPDLFVANDGLNAYLYHNERNGTFKGDGNGQRDGRYRPGEGHGGDVHLSLQVARIDDLRRKCDLGYDGRKAACPLFWSLGASQVGKAAIIGWRDVLVPALSSDRSVAIWPFDGSRRTLKVGRLVIVETYPGVLRRVLSGWAKRQKRGCGGQDESGACFVQMGKKGERQTRS
jgi:hypothetical protein